MKDETHEEMKNDIEDIIYNYTSKEFRYNEKDSELQCKLAICLHLVLIINDIIREVSKKMVEKMSKT